MMRHNNEFCRVSTEAVWWRWLWWENEMDTKQLYL